MTPPRRLLVIADVGGDTTRHIGDEAMLEANIEGLRDSFERVEIVVMSRDPKWISTRYGVDAVPLFGFPEAKDATDEREALLTRLKAAAPSVHPSHPALEALRSADAVVISGGGNLSSSWPDLLWERIAALALAKLLGKPAIVLGQTLGPHLEDLERVALGDALATAAFVGVRDLPSAALAVALGVSPRRIWYQADDALKLGELLEGSHATNGSEPSIVVTIDPQFRAIGTGRVRSLARQLRQLAEESGATCVLVPHAFGTDSGAGSSDSAEAALLAEEIGLRSTVIATGLQARDAARLTRTATLVVSSRYHPIVFAVASGTPCIGIYGNEYCRIKIEGALAHAGLLANALSYDDVIRGAVLDLGRRLLRIGKASDHEAGALRARWRDESQRRWLAVRHAIVDGTTSERPEEGSLLGRQPSELVPQLLATIECGRAASVRLERRLEDVTRIAIALERMARPWLAARRFASRVYRTFRRHE